MQNVNETELGEEPEMPAHEPAINLPTVVLVLILIMAAIHAIRMWALPDSVDNLVIYLFAFIPATYGPLAQSAPFPLAGYWSPITHAFLHGDWLHLGMNTIWMAAFGAPLARRFGAMRFLVLSALCACGGALLHFWTYENEFVPVIGASGAVSGYMGAASRFIFNSKGRGNRFDPHGRAMSLMESFANRGFVMFFAIWMGMNYIFGAGFLDIGGEGSLIAWQAHVGGFLAGVLLFGWFDPQKKAGNA